MKKFSPAIMILGMLCVCALLQSCSKSNDDKSPSKHAMYLWKNYYYGMDKESADSLLDANDIDRLYVKFFEVQCDNGTKMPVPDAEPQLRSILELLDGREVVPTVFITRESLDLMQGCEKEYSEKVFNRIMSQLAEAKITEIPEIQIDCDWTKTSQDTYFKFLKALAERVHGIDAKLSATIRLHQLDMKEPPVDRGVLMVYNVGNLKDINETNSILRADEVKKYTSTAPKYALPLDVALPAFSWGVVFRNGKFVRLISVDGDIEQYPEIVKDRDNIYKVIPTDDYSYLNVTTGEIVRYEQPSAQEILKAKEYVLDYLGYAPENIILYHLDLNQLSKYDGNEIAEFYK